MGVFDFITLGGGLALFLYGMSVMGSGLERIAGRKLENVLEKLTDNIFLAVLVGMSVTALIQSSSATTVIVVGFVNAGILKLRQAIGVIMGANIGTTVTAHIIRLTDIDGSGIFSQIFKPSTLIPVFAIVGILLLLTSKKAKIKVLGEVMLGFAVLFTGLFAMEAAVSGLKDSPSIASLFSILSNPFLGILAGAAVTAIIQSSSASIGILQVLSSTGMITFSTAFPIILGQNIGNCAIPLMSSAGANKNAKRAAMIHLYFNLIGMAVFLILTYSGAYILKRYQIFDFWSPELIVNKGIIANFHTIFNVATTLLLLPFAGLLEKLALLTIRSKNEPEFASESGILDDRFFLSPAIAINQVRTTVVQMAKYAQANFHDAASLCYRYDLKTADRMMEMENAIDKMEDRLEGYLLKLSDNEMSDTENKSVSELLHLINEFERIGDYSVNVMEKAKRMYDKGISFSPLAMREIQAISDAVGEIISMAVDCFVNNDAKAATFIEPLEETIDDMEELLKDKHIDRLRKGQCVVDAGIVFVEMLTDLERIADHCSNIAVYVIGYEGHQRNFDRHEYLRKMHAGTAAEYNEKYAYYEDKYMTRIC